MTESDTTTVGKPCKVEFGYLGSSEELGVKIMSGDGNDCATNYFPLSGSKKIDLAMELLGHGSVSAMVSELEEKREALAEAEASLLRLHREWMVQNIELNASQAECMELRKLYLEEGEKAERILRDAAVQG